MESNNQKDESFRDSISTINSDGNRIYVYPKKPKGRIYNYRKLLGWLLLAFFFIVPYIKLNGDPFLLLNVIERKFVIFGVIFWPQDTYIFAIMMITIMVFIVVFTVALGRLWCGWACPQTIFMEILFRQVEYLIDGNSSKQRKLAKQSWNFEKIWKRALKFVIFLFLSMLIAYTLFSWVVGYEKIIFFIQDGIANHKSTFLGFLLLSGIILFIYSWFREQVCTILCPYGRLQGVLLDSKSLVVSYDYKRGEPKSNFKKGEDRKDVGKGDCIDCRQCIEVCPTNIDIRNGTQLECVNCMACIDACNATMTRVGLPQGLIRMDSETGISTGKKFKLNIRLGAYILVLIALFTFLVLMLFGRTEIESTILRTPGLLYQVQSNGEISNLYNIKVINKTREDIPIDIKLISPSDGRIEVAGGGLNVNSSSLTEGVIIVYLPIKNASGKVPITFGVFAGLEQIEEIYLTFVGPE